MGTSDWPTPQVRLDSPFSNFQWSGAESSRVRSSAGCYIAVTRSHSATTHLRFKWATDVVEEWGIVSVVRQRIPFSVLRLSVNFLVTPNTKSNQFLFRVIPQPAPGLKMMDLKILNAAAVRNAKIASIGLSVRYPLSALLLEPNESGGGDRSDQEKHRAYQECMARNRVAPGLKQCRAQTLTIERASHPGD